MQQISRVERFAAFCIERRIFVTTLLLALTVVFTYFAAHVQIKTIFHDLLPKGHPFIEINDKYNERFGGPNIVSIMVEAENGDIFQPKVLERIKQVTDDLYLVPAMNHCRAGPATDQFDLLGPLVDWVEQGKAPAAVPARVRGAGTQVPNPELPAGWAADRSRPLCPWPQVARYNGSGDAERAENFSCRL